MTVDDLAHDVASLREEVDEQIRRELQATVDGLRGPGGPLLATPMLYRLGLKLMNLVFEAASRSWSAKPPEDEPEANADATYLAARVDEAKELRLIPKEMATFLDWGRHAANPIKHNDESAQMDLGDAVLRLAGYLRVLRWFYCEYEHGPSLPTIFAEDSRNARGRVDPPQALRRGHAPATDTSHRRLPLWRDPGVLLLGSVAAAALVGLALPPSALAPRAPRTWTDVPAQLAETENEACVAEGFQVLSSPVSMADFGTADVAHGQPARVPKIDAEAYATRVEAALPTPSQWRRLASAGAGGHPPRSACWAAWRRCADEQAPPLVEPPTSVEWLSSGPDPGRSDLGKAGWATGVGRSSNLHAFRLVRPIVDLEVDATSAGCGTEETVRLAAVRHAGIVHEALRSRCGSPGAPAVILPHASTGADSAQVERRRRLMEALARRGLETLSVDVCASGVEAGGARSCERTNPVHGELVPLGDSIVAAVRYALSAGAPRVAVVAEGLAASAALHAYGDRLHSDDRVVALLALTPLPDPKAYSVTAQVG